jgi:hypothetical protein
LTGTNLGIITNTTSKNAGAILFRTLQSSKRTPKPSSQLQTTATTLQNPQQTHSNSLKIISQPSIFLRDFLMARISTKSVTFPKIQNFHFTFQNFFRYLQTSKHLIFTHVSKATGIFRSQHCRFQKISIFIHFLIIYHIRAHHAV